MVLKKTGKPSVKEGNSGDIKAVKESGKTSLYAKLNNVWDKIGIDVIGNPPYGSLAFFQDNNTLQFNQSLMYKLGVFKFTKSIDVTGDITASGDILFTGKQIYFAHDGAEDSNNDYMSFSDDPWETAGGVLSLHADQARGVSSSSVNMALFADGIYSRGKVGIGTTTPSADLHINNSSAEPTILLTGQGGNPADAARIRLSEQEDGNNYIELKYDGSANILSFDSNNQADMLSIDRSNNRVFTGASTNVGIGTSTPSTKLDVNGTVKATGFTIGGHTIDDIDIGSEFVDTDDHLMSSGAIKEKIESYGYSTTAGDITGVTAGDGLTGGGSSGSVTLAVGVDDSTIEINSDALRVKDDGITYAKIQNVTATDRILGRDSAGAGVIEEITPTNLRTMINVADGATANAGTVTSVGTGTGLDGGAITSSGTISLSFDELPDGTADVVGGSDELIYLDLQGDGTKDLKRKQIDEIKLGQFNNDQGWTDNAGDITGVSFTDDAGASITDNDGQAAFTIAGGTNLTSSVSGSTVTLNQTTFTHIITHNFDCTGTGAVYIPFGGSQTESFATGDSLDDETRFITPYAGKLIKVVFQSASAGGATDILLRVNGTDGSGAASTPIAGANSTVTLTVNSSSNSFSAGDRLRVKIDPTNAPDEIAMTSVWEFTL